MNDLVIKTVDVLGSDVIVAQDKEGKIYAGVKWLCDGIGLSEGQRQRQTTNIQSDIVLEEGVANLQLPTNGGEQVVLCLDIDYVPLWLAKIPITPSMKKDNPELTKKLKNYQLKAKDILAEAFIPKAKIPITTDEKIVLLAQGHTELKQEVDGIKAEVEALKYDLPILPLEAEQITNAVKKKGVEVLGGKTSNAYNNRSLRQKTYNSIYGTLKYNFEISSYKQLKRSQTSKAVDIVADYAPPYFLEEQIKNENAQQRLEV